MRVLERHQPRLDRRVLQHDGVGHVLDRRDLLGRHRLGVREVEAQPVGRDQRALLRDVRAQHLAQRLVQQVGGGVVGARGRAARVIDDQLDGVARLERALLDRADMHEQVAQLLLRVGDAEQRALRPLDDALVADLAAGLAVERRLVEHERRLLAGLEALRPPCRP